MIKIAANRYKLTGLINNKHIITLFFGLVFLCTSYNINPKYYKKKI